MKRKIWILLFLVLSILTVSSLGCIEIEPTETPVPTLTPTPYITDLYDDAYIESLIKKFEEATAKKDTMITIRSIS